LGGGTSNTQVETRTDAGAPSDGAVSDADNRTLERRSLVRVALFENLSRHRHGEPDPAPSRVPAAAPSRLRPAAG
jgi:hypothetical protein